jgi:uncharacterized DUF497 family protein
MSLQIDTALREGFRRTVSRNGLLLVGVFLVFSFLNLVLSQSLFEALEPVLLEQFSTLPEQSLEQFRQTFDEPRPFAVPIPPSVGAALTVLAAVVAEAIRIVSIRVFATEETDSFPQATASHRLVAATINGIVAGILVSLAIGAGLILLLVPGIFIALSFFFVRQEIAVENKTFIDAMRDSWTLTGGNRWELLGLAVILLVIGFIASSPSIVLSFVSPMASTALGTTIGSVTTVFAIAVTTRAYEQLRRERAELMDPDYEEPDQYDDPQY